MNVNKIISGELIHTAVAGPGNVRSGSGHDLVVVRTAATERADMRLYRFEQIESIPEEVPRLSNVDEVTLSTPPRSGRMDHDHVIEVQGEIVAPSEQHHFKHEEIGHPGSQVQNVYTYVPHEPLTPTHEPAVAMDVNYLTSAWSRTAGYLQFDDRSQTGSIINKIV
jgi:hypothetical protein